MPTHHKRTAAGLLLLACVLTLALLILTVVFMVQKLAPPPAPAPSESDSSDSSAEGNSDSPPDGVTLAETPDLGIDYQDRLTFVGDSRTARLADHGLLSGGTATKQLLRTESGIFNLMSGMSKQTVIHPGPGEHTGRLLTVAEIVALKKPGILIVMLGSDWGVTYLSEADFKACYTEFIEGIRKASPTTTVVLQSVFPVAEICRVLSNAQIDSANKWIRAVAAETDCFYLDTQSALKDESGALKPAYSAPGDGTRLTTEGYAAVLTYIRTHAVPEE